MLSFKKFLLEDDDLEDFVTKTKEKHGLKSFHVGKGFNSLQLNMIGVSKEEQGKGKGSGAMRDLADYADSKGMTVTLTTGQRDKNWGTTSSTRLKKFYKQHGFVENKGRNKDFSLSGNMYRKPINQSS